MNKKRMIESIKFMFKKSGRIDLDRVDFEAEVDSSLSLGENYRILKERYSQSFWDR